MHVAEPSALFQVAGGPISAAHSAVHTAHPATFSPILTLARHPRCTCHSQLVAQPTCQVGTLAKLPSVLPDKSLNSNYHPEEQHNGSPISNTMVNTQVLLYWYTLLVHCQQRQFCVHTSQQGACCCAQTAAATHGE